MSCRTNMHYRVEWRRWRRRRGSWRNKVQKWWVYHQPECNLMQWISQMTTITVAIKNKNAQRHNWRVTLEPHSRLLCCCRFFRSVVVQEVENGEFISGREYKLKQNATNCDSGCLSLAVLSSFCPQSELPIILQDRWRDQFIGTVNQTDRKSKFTVQIVFWALIMDQAAVLLRTIRHWWNVELEQQRSGGGWRSRGELRWIFKVFLYLHIKLIIFIGNRWWWSFLWLEKRWKRLLSKFIYYYRFFSRFWIHIVKES